MSLKTNILTKEELSSIWPGKNNAFKCTMLNSDNSKYEILIPKAECELLMYLKHLKGKISQDEMNKLEYLIGEYGDEKYYESSIDASMNDENI